MLNELTFEYQSRNVAKAAGRRAAECRELLVEEIDGWNSLDRFPELRKDSADRISEYRDQIKRFDALKSKLSKEPDRIINLTLDDIVCLGLEE